MWHGAELMRVIIELAVSVAILAVCREKLAHERVQQQVEAAMQMFELGEQLAFITLPFCPFQHPVTAGGSSSMCSTHAAACGRNTGLWRMT